MAIMTDGKKSTNQSTKTTVATKPTQPVNPTYTQTQLDAKGVIDGFLSQFGLQSLGDWAWSQFLNGKPVSEIMVELRSRPEYKARFPAMDTLAKKGRAMSEAEYVAYERQAAGLFRVAGLPAGFYDSPADFSNLIANEVSINELSTRVQTAYTAVKMAPQEVRDAFQKYYGPGSDQALAAYMLDPNKALPLIEQQISAAQFTGIGTRFGYQLSQQQAEALGREGLTSDQITAGYQRADAIRPLADESLGEGLRGQDITQQDVLEAAFGMKSDQAVQQRIKSRVAGFSGSGGADQSQYGATGLGGSQR